jgi:hypothetical protein
MWFVVLACCMYLLLWGDWLDGTAQPSPVLRIYYSLHSWRHRNDASEFRAAAVAPIPVPPPSSQPPIFVFVSLLLFVS